MGGLLCILGMISCSKNEDVDITLCFVGDSMIANWDVARMFPNRRVENKGVDGIGIQDISNLNLAKPEEDVIVLVGTNDIKSSMTESELDAYVLQYVDAILHLNARRIVLISVLPSAYKTKNQNIETVNKNVRDDMAGMSSVLFIDCYGSFLREGVIKEELTRDGTHLNDYGYILLTDLVKDWL